MIRPGSPVNGFDRMDTDPFSSHRFEPLFSADDERVLLLTFRDGDVFRLRSFSTVDESVYGTTDCWTATVVEPVSGVHPDFKRLFAAGTGVDFVESDIAEIADDLTGEVLFRDHGSA